MLSLNLDGGLFAPGRSRDSMSLDELLKMGCEQLATDRHFQLVERVLLSRPRRTDTMQQQNELSAESDESEESCAAAWHVRGQVRIGSGRVHFLVHLTIVATDDNALTLSIQTSISP